MPRKLDITFGEIYWHDHTFMRAEVFQAGEHIGVIEANAWHQPEQRGWHFVGREIWGEPDECGYSHVRLFAQLIEWRRLKLPCEDYLLPHELR